MVVHAKNTLYRFPIAQRNHPKNIQSLSPIATDVPEEKGCAFPHGDALFLLIGGAYYRILADGSIGMLGKNGCDPYVPLTYYNTEAYEQRNLLTDEVRHVFTADGDYRMNENAEDGLRYNVFSEEDKTASVYVSEYYRTACTITVPPTCDINGEIC